MIFKFTVEASWSLRASHYEFHPCVKFHLYAELELVRTALRFVLRFLFVRHIVDLSALFFYDDMALKMLPLNFLGLSRISAAKNQ